MNSNQYMIKKALITGVTCVTGQDGSYIAEVLLENGNEEHGIKRRASSFNTQRTISTSTLTSATTVSLCTTAI